MNKGFTYIFLSIFFSFLFSLSDSRLITTWDMPSKYTLYENYSNSDPISTNNSTNEYDLPSGLAFSYEHRLVDKEKYNFYLGSEIMLGKKSNVSLAFHSIYLMSTYQLSESSDVLFRLGYSMLNSNDEGYPNSAYMWGLGSEIEISETWSVNFFNTFYKTNSKKNSVDVYPIFPIDDFNEEFMFNKIKYSKFSISLVYKLRKKEENNS